MATHREALSSFQTEKLPFGLSLMTVGGGTLFSNVIPVSVITFRDLRRDLCRSCVIPAERYFKFVDTEGRLLPPEAILRQQCQDGDRLTIVFYEPKLALVRDKLPDPDSRLVGEEDMLQIEANLRMILVALHELLTTSMMPLQDPDTDEAYAMEIFQDDAYVMEIYHDGDTYLLYTHGTLTRLVNINIEGENVPLEQGLADFSRYTRPKRWKREVLKRRRNSKQLRRRFWKQLRQMREDNRRVLQVLTPLFQQTGMSVKLRWTRLVDGPWRNETLFAALA